MLDYLERWLDTTATVSDLGDRHVTHGGGPSESPVAATHRIIQSIVEAFFPHTTLTTNVGQVNLYKYL